MPKYKYKITKIETGEEFISEGLRDAVTHFEVAPGTLYNKEKYIMEILGNIPKRRWGKKQGNYTYDWSKYKKKQPRKSSRCGNYNNWDIIQFSFSQEVIVYDKTLQYTDNPLEVDWDNIRTDLQTILNFYFKYNTLTLKYLTTNRCQYSKKHMLKIEVQIGIPKDTDICSKKEKSQKVIDLIDKYIEKNLKLYEKECNTATSNNTDAD